MFYLDGINLMVVLKFLSNLWISRFVWFN